MTDVACLVVAKVNLLLFFRHDLTFKVSVTNQSERDALQAISAVHNKLGMIYVRLLPSLDSASVPLPFTQPWHSKH